MEARLRKKCETVVNFHDTSGKCQIYYYYFKTFYDASGMCKIYVIPKQRCLHSEKKRKKIIICVRYTTSILSPFKF